MDLNPLHLPARLRASRDAWTALNAKAGHYDELAGYYQEWRTLAESLEVELTDRTGMIEARDRRLVRLDKVIARQGRYIGQLEFERDYLLGERVKDLRPAGAPARDLEQLGAEAAWALGAYPSLGRLLDGESSGALATWRDMVEANPDAAALLAEPSGAWPAVPAADVVAPEIRDAVYRADVTLGEDVATGLLLVHLERAREPQPMLAADVDAEILGPVEDALRCVAPWNGRRCPQLAGDGTDLCVDHAGTDESVQAGAAA